VYISSVIFFYIDTGQIDMLNILFQNHTLSVLDAQHKAIMHYHSFCLRSRINLTS